MKLLAVSVTAERRMDRNVRDVCFLEHHPHAAIADELAVFLENGIVRDAVFELAHQRAQLDNVDVGVYSTVYNFSTFSNT